jgi:MSHA biogenesis protein MshM
MNYLQHFGLKHDPLGNDVRHVVHCQQETQLIQKLNWLLQTKGVGLIIGDAGTGKTTVLREWANTLNPMTHQVVYQSDNHFKPFDIYCQLADHFGLDKYHRYSKLWRALKHELLNLIDHKQISPIWILDEAHLLAHNFLVELPAFLNFSFDSRNIITIIMVGLPTLQGTLKKSIYSALHSRILFQFNWQAIDDQNAFCKFIIEAFKNAGKHETMISQSGLQLIHMASKGKLRYAHQIITQALQKAAEGNCNHLTDQIIEQSLEELMQ